LGLGFGSLITSRTRAAVIMRLFLNPACGAYLRELAGELGCSTSQARGALKQLTKAGFLRFEQAGRQRRYHANTKHALFPKLRSMVHKALGMDRILDSIIDRLGNLELALLLDDYAEGKDSGIVGRVLVGSIDQRNLLDLVHNTERYIDRKIRTFCLTCDEYNRLRPNLDRRPQLLLWRGSERFDVGGGARTGAPDSQPRDGSDPTRPRAQAIRQADV